MQAIVDSLAPYAAHVGVAVIAGALLIQFLPLSLGQLAPTPEVGGYPGGLYNPGNYCFVNSVIQSLVNLKSLQDELSNPGGPVGAALATLAKQLNATHSYPLICTNNALLVAINSKGGNDHLVGYNQQDAHELFQVVSALYDNELKPSCKATMQLVDESQYFKAVFLGKGCQIPVPKISRSPFSGLMASRICCLKCCYKTPMRLDVFDNLSLTCPKAPFASLDSLLDEYTRTEFIDDYTCPKCSLLGTRKLLKPSSPMLFIIDKAIKMGDFEIELPKNVLLKVASKVSKQTWLAFLPQCVCLHMQRSVYTMSGAYKNNCRVQIPEMLDLSRFMNPIIDSEWIGGTDISTVPCGPPIHVQHEVKEQPSQESSPIIQSPSISANTKRAKKNRKLKKRKRQMRVDEIEKSALPRDQPTSPESIETAIEIHAFKSAMESFVRVQVPVFPAVISEPNPNLIYNLSSIILHYGSHHSGHFVTLRKIDAVWYRISDGQVHRIGDIPHETVSQYVYMAFYEREN